MARVTKKSLLVAEAKKLGLNSSGTAAQLEARIKAKKRYNPETPTEDKKSSDPTVPTVLNVESTTQLDATASNPPSSLTTPTTPAPKPNTFSAAVSKMKAPSDNAPHLVIVARAGTGKTTTLVEGMADMRGVAPHITPSIQQAAIWDQMRLSSNAKTLRFTCFNKAIATTLEEKLKERGLDKKGCEAGTMHSLGYKAVNQVMGYQKPTSWAVSNIIGELYEKDIRDLKTEKAMIIMAAEKLTALCKQNLVTGTRDELDELIGHYDIEIEDDQANEVYYLVPRILALCKKPKGEISFDDMIWLPIILNLAVPKFDVLLVDEAQDLNRCQQALAKKAGHRLILCGDPKQAIYGFAGADSKSMERMAEELGHRLSYNGDDNNPEFTPSGRGCITLPLTVTRRCGKVIVEEAKKYVPDFEAHENNPEGKISFGVYAGESTPLDMSRVKAFLDNEGRGDEIKPQPPTSYHSQVQAGDMLLCRVNAPLVSQCFKFIRMGKKANIQGRDIGQGLISTVKKMKASNVDELAEKLTKWHEKEQEKEEKKKHPNENKLIALQDRYDCLMCFTEEATSIEGVIAKIESIFTDDKTTTGILLSSIHKAKGLEAKRVFILRPKGAECPHPMAKTYWQREQEYNLLYVAITRAIEELTYVS